MRRTRSQDDDDAEDGEQQQQQREVDDSDEGDDAMESSNTRKSDNRSSWGWGNDSAWSNEHSSSQQQSNSFWNDRPFFTDDAVAQQQRNPWSSWNEEPAANRSNADADDDSHMQIDETSHQQSVEPNLSFARDRGLEAAWTLKINPNVKKPFKPPTRVTAATTAAAATATGSGSVAASSSTATASTPSLLATQAAIPAVFKHHPSRAPPSSRTFLPSTPTIVQPPTNLQIKPIRFVKSGQVLNADHTPIQIDTDSNAASSTAAASTAAASNPLWPVASKAPSITKSGGLKGSKLLQAPLLASAALARSATSSSSAKASRAGPSLLLVKPAVTGSTKKSFVSPLKGGAASNATLTVASVIKVTYNIAGYKNSKHRDGYLHLFKSNWTESEPAAASAAATGAPDESATLTSALSSTSFL
ncbi:MAG: hypothetical protein Q7T57_06855, partial [Dehalococcoidales bacterium]|nr:hypothetical protein [Dehalococcoidales bacterium]